MRLIVTRPEPDASRTADALRRLGHEPILSPMLDIVHDGGVALPNEPFQAAIVTSRNAVRAIVSHPERRRVTALSLFAVGVGSALEAKRAGFAAARSGGGDANDLVRLAAAELDPRAGPVLYLAGEDQAGDPAGSLRQAGFTVETVVIYRAVPCPGLSAEAAAALRRDGSAGVLLYSRRSAAAFADAALAADLLPLRPGTTLFCISAAVAEPVRSSTRGAVAIADRPDQLGLFALVERAAGRPAHVRNS